MKKFTIFSLIFFLILPSVNAQVEVHPGVFFKIRSYDTYLTFSYHHSFSEIQVGADKIWFDDNWISVMKANLTVNDWFKTNPYDLIFSLNSSIGTNSVVWFYCGDKGKPAKVYLNGEEIQEETMWDYDPMNNILNLSVVHSSQSMHVLVQWRVESTTTTTTTIPICSGHISLTFFPNPIWASKMVTANISGLSNCGGKKAYIKRGSYKIYTCSCIVLDSGCSCSFSAPRPTDSGTSFTYYAQVDLNDDGKIDTEEEEKEDLVVLCHGEGEKCNDQEPCCFGYYCKDGTCVRTTGGGCPVLKAWNRKEFKEIEKLNIHSEEGVDTTYSTSFKMKPFKENIYEIILQEKWYLLWEGSHVDSVKLIDSEGKECNLIKAIHSKLGDVTSLIKESDDERVEIKPGESIELVYTDCGGEEFKLKIEGYNPWWRFAKLELSYRNLIIVIVTIVVLALIILSSRRFYKI